SQNLDTTIFLIESKIISIDRPEGYVSEPLTIKGTGYKADKVLTIHFGTKQSITTTQVNSNGTFSTTFIINAQPHNTKVITVVPQSPARINTTIFIIRTDIKSINPSSGPPSALDVPTIITLQGDGFFAGETITIRYCDDSGAQATETFTANGDGQLINGTFSVPYNAKTGVTVITATGWTSQDPTTIIFTVGPGIVQILPTSGAVGDIISIVGGGFGTQSLLWVDFGTHMTITTTMTSVTGTFSATFIVSTQPVCTKMLTATTVSTEGTVSTATALMTPGIFAKIPYIMPNSGPVGQVVTIFGTGQLANGTVNIGFGTNPTITTAQTNGDGTFCVTFIIDTQPIGTQVVTSYYGSNWKEIATNLFVITPQITLVTPIEAYVNQPITVWGTGYGNGETIQIDFGTHYTITTVTASTNGTFSVTFLVSTQESATKIITATGITSVNWALPERWATTDTFEIRGDIVTVAPITGVVGSVITVWATGYKDIEAVQIDFGTQMTITTAIPSSNGTFSVTFMINTQPYGTTRITAKGLASNEIDTDDSFLIDLNMTVLNPTLGRVGSTVTVEGTGYPSAGTVTIGFGQGIIPPPEGSISTSGTFSITFIVNTQKGGEAKGVWASLYINGIPHWTYKCFHIMGDITQIAPLSGPLGTDVTVKGTGFGAVGTKVYIHFGDTKTITTTTTDGGGGFSYDGIFTAVFKVDTQFYGTKVITATDEKVYTSEGTSYQLGWDTAVFVIVAGVSYAPSQGPVGTKIELAGAGFDACGSVTIDFGTSQTITTTIASSEGYFSTSFIVDTQPYGSTVFTVRSIEDTATKVFSIIPNIILVTPISGKVGSVVTVEGTGYPATDSGISIRFQNTGGIAIGTSSENGTFSITFIVNTQISQTKLIRASATNSTIKDETNIFQIKGNIAVINPVFGRVGSVVTVVGTGYGVAGTQVRIDFGSSRTITTAIISTTNGTFSVTFLINTQPYQTKVITAQDLTELATGTYKVIPDIAQVVPNSGIVSTSVTLIGTGFHEGEMVRIDFGTHETITTTQVSSENGTFSITFIVNTQPAGSEGLAAPSIITATGEVSGPSATNIFQIKPRITLLTPTSGVTGINVNLQGDGYGNIEHLQVWMGNLCEVIMSSNPTSPSGTFSIGFTVSAHPAGSNIITVIGLISGQIATTTYIVVAKIWFDDQNTTFKEGYVGATIPVNGSGYQPGEMVSISFGTHQTITTAIVNGAGQFTTNMTIDTQSYGTKDVTAKGSNSGSVGSAKFKINPKMVFMTPSSGKVQTEEISIFATGFGSNTLIAIHFGTSQTITTATTTENGTFSVSFKADTQPYGETLITGFDTTEQVWVTTIFTITPDIYSLIPLSGVVGTPVTVMGRGHTAFSGGFDNFYFYFGDKQYPIDTNIINSNGTFSYPFTVDIQSYGTKTITVKDHENKISTTIFIILPEIKTVSPTEGEVNQVVTVMGEGYRNGVDVVIDFGTSLTIATTQASPKGIFSCTFMVNTQSGTSIITARQDSVVFDITSFGIKPTITLLSPTNGIVGDEVTVIGKGYSAGGILRLDFGTYQTITTTLVSGNGTFSLTFVVNTQAGGTLTITATTEGLSAVTTSFYLAAKIIYREPSFGSPELTVVTVIGNGYGNGEQIKISFGITETKTTTISTEHGTFSATFLCNIQPFGTIAITAIGPLTQYATTTFTINIGIILLTSTEGIVGTKVTIGGAGFSNDELAWIDFGTTQTITTVKVNNTNGTFNTTFLVSTQAFGSITITMYAQDSGGTAITTFFIRASLVKIYPPSAKVGELITVEGVGFKKNEVIGIGFGTTQTITTTTATSDTGTFSVTFLVNTQGYSTKRITATGTESNETPSLYLFKLIPNIVWIAPGSGTVDTVITLLGTGYSVGSVTRISFGTTVTIATAIADTFGTFSVTFMANTQPQGYRVITALDASTEFDTDKFEIIGKIILVSPASGNVGDQITVIGIGFVQLGSVSVSFGKTASITTASTNINGTFSQVFKIDTQVIGTKIITAHGSIDATSFFYIKPKVILVEPSQGPLDTVVVVQGTGYGSKTLIQIDFGTTKTISTTTSTEDGTFSATFSVNIQPQGATVITAMNNETGEYATSIFSIGCVIAEVKPTEGIVGSVVTVRGTGYNEGEEIHIGFGSTATITTTTGQYAGTFSTTFITNTQPEGMRIITAYGLTSHQIDTDTGFSIKGKISWVRPES
ncbi:MAG: IPT/TIG domain-containing protein, partial [Candidatus Desantisbacteria bacterium]